MSKFEKIKHKYCVIMNQVLEDNRDIIINSFTEFYGEEYRSIITNRLDDVVFASYLYFNDIEKSLKNDIETILNYPEFHVLYDVYKEFLKHAKTHEVDILDTLIGLNIDESHLYARGFMSHFKELLDNSNAYYVHADFGKDDYIRLIAFQMFLTVERTIIHEINHAMTTDSLLFVEDSGKIHSIARSGVECKISSEKGYFDQIFDELLNEYSALKIFDIFKRNGGNFSQICFPINTHSIYENNFFLIEDFYNLFSEEINYARISGNLNSLIKRVGKDNYNKLVEIVNKYYVGEAIEISEDVKSEAKKEIEEVLLNMIDSFDEEKDFKEEELSKYYDYLKESGLKLKIIRK